MKAFILLFSLLYLSGRSETKHTPPVVNVYTRDLSRMGEENRLICHASGFYPPEIKLELLRDGKEIPETIQSDLAFDGGWHYYLTKYTSITPGKGLRFSCRVTHNGKTSTHDWDPDE